MDDIKINVQMSAETFEEFIQYRKNKAIYEEKANGEISRLRNYTSSLAIAVLDSVNGKTAKDKKEAKEEALELANEWFS